MDIRISTSKKTRVVLSKSERNALWTTLTILDAVQKHLEEPLILDHREDWHGAAGLLLHDGFLDFVQTYASKELPTEGEDADEPGT